MGNSMSILVLLPIVAIAVFMFMKKRKNSGKQNTLSNRENKKDEVWRTIKTFLKQNNEYGKEIISSFVAKRPNALQKTATKKEFVKKIKTTIIEQNMNRKQARVYKEQMHKDQNRELYCILFVTRDAKTKVLDPQRIIEAEVTYKTVKKNERKREIKIIGLTNFEKDYAWIKPIKEKEDKIIARIEHRKQIEKERKAKRQQRKNERLQRKAAK